MLFIFLNNERLSLIAQFEQNHREIKFQAVIHLINQVQLAFG